MRFTNASDHFHAATQQKMYVFSKLRLQSLEVTTNPTIFNIICWVAGSLGWPSAWCSKYYFFFHNFFAKIISIYFLIVHNLTKFKIKSFQCTKSIRNYEKKIMLGTSDTWSMSRSSHRPSEPAHYIEDCRISHDLGRKKLMASTLSRKVNAIVKFQAG